MTESEIDGLSPHPGSFELLRTCAAWAVLCGFISGCTSVPVHQMGLVSKPNMVFSDSAVFSVTSKLWVQTEPGVAFSGGAQAGGCTFCK